MLIETGLQKPTLLSSLIEWIIIPPPLPPPSRLQIRVIETILTSIVQS